MNIDGLSMHFLAKELKTTIVGAHISKIIQLSSSLFVFNLRLKKLASNNKAELRLLIDVDKNNPAVLLTDKNMQAPVVAPNFCMFLRKYLQNGQILSIDCPNFERYLILTISAKNSYYDLVEYKLVIELMGRYSNLILLENGIIKDCLLHIDNKINSQRELLPMHPYVAPPAQNCKKSLLSFNSKSELQNHLLANISDLALKKLADLLLNKILGISPLISKSLCLQANLDTNCLIASFINEPKQQLALVNILWQLREFILNTKGEAHLYRKQDEWLNLLALPIFGCPNDKQISCPSFSAALLKARSQSAFNSAFSQKQSLLLQNLNQQINKLNNKLSTYQTDITSSLDFAVDKIKGDLLLAHIANYKDLVKSRTTSEELAIVLENYYQTALPDDLLNEISQYISDPQQQFNILELISAAEIKILIKKDKSFAMNAKNYFKSYSKKKNRLLIVHALAKDCQQNLQYYAECRINVLNACTLSDLDAIKSDLYNFNANNLADIQRAKSTTDNEKNLPGKPASRKRILLARQREQANNQRRLNKTKQQQQKAKDHNNLDFISYISSEGYQILIGKNASQNDYLSLHHAKPNDLWLHLQKAPGCHVLIVNPQKDSSDNISERTIKEAAMLCAWFSRSQEERHLLKTQALASVNVDYCPASKLKKAAKAKAGLVYYNNYRTIKVQGQSPEQLNLKIGKLLETSITNE